MGDAKAFDRAARLAADEGVEWIELAHEDRTLRALAEPSPGQVAVLQSKIMHGTGMERLGMMISFFVNVLDEESSDYVTRRLMTPDHIDPFGMEEVENLLSTLMEEWSGRPTQPSSGSTPPPPNDGPKSVQPTPLLT